MPEPREPRPRGRFLIGARVITGTIGVVVGAGVIAAATFLPLPTAQRVPVGVTVTPSAATQQVICPGGVLRLGDESGANATEATAIDEPTLARGATTGDLVSRVLASTAAGGGLGAPVLLSVPGSDESTIAGAQSQLVRSNDYSGFAAAECGAPSSDAWLVGGSTTVGRTTLVTIANPGAVSSTVTLEIFGDDGRVDAPGTSGIVVAANSQRVLSLAGFAPDSSALAVHVTSRGGPVLANLQQSIVRGIDPGGLDIVGPTSPPATGLVIPGVLVSDSLGVAELRGGDDYADLDSVLRVLVPGDAPAQLTVSITPDATNPVHEGEGEPSTPGGASFTVTVDAGVVTDVPIDHLDDGRYSIEVVSSVPVAAALRVSTASDGVSDLAWFSAARALTGDAYLAVADGPSAALSLSNPGTVAIVAALDGQSIEVPAGSTVSIAIADGRTASLTGAAGLYASIGYAGDGALGSYVVSASATAEPPITVYP